MNSTLKISEVKYFPPTTSMGKPLQEHCEFKGINETSETAIFSAYGKYARKLMRKIISKKKVVCFCSFATFTAPLKNEKGVRVLDNNEYPVLTTNTVFIVKRILDYNPKTTYIGTNNPVHVFPFLFIYPKVQKKKRVNKRALSERLFPTK